MKSAFPAFPAIQIKSGDNYNPPTKIYHTGMTLEDYFAAKAMQGLLSNMTGILEDYHYTDKARAAYRMANAMLVERMKGTKHE